jgi:Tol biopolymer transport system component
VPRARILGLAALLAIPLAPAAGRASTPSLIVFSADRAPQLSYEIFRLDPNGNQVDLSQSPSEDHQPLVSPDGKKVAFLSYRSSAPGQGSRVFEVGIDGSKLRNMAPSLSVNGSGSVAWQPHGDRLAAIADDNYGGPTALWILRWGHRPIRALSKGHGLVGPNWSPDGRVLVAWSGYAWRAFSPAGRRLWKHESRNWGGCCGASWSAHGLLAVTTEQRLRVYDESGHTRFEARLPIEGRVGPPSWSPGGREVGVVSGGVVEVRTAGGRLVLRKRLPSVNPHKPASIAWSGDRRLVAGIPVTGPQEGVDLRTGRLWNASSVWLDPRSADGKLAIVTSQDGVNTAIGVVPVGSGPTKRYGETCGIKRTLGAPQFVGRTRSIVYESACTPPSDLYSMAPDGSGLHQVPGIEPHVVRAVLSPDGTQVAYTWISSPNSGLGEREIRVANVDGTGERVLASPMSDCSAPNSPTWSPDGQTILFSEETIDTASSCNGVELYTVAAAGGPAHDTGIAGSDAEWGPSRIAYNGPNGFTTANPDWSDPEVIAPFVGARAWSADGRLAYTTGVNETTVVVVGGGTVALPFAEVTSLAWSADGTRFVVTAQKTLTDPRDVYTVNTDGSDPVRLTTGYNASGVNWR